MTEEERLAKNSRITQTKGATMKRHKSMSCKTFDIKIQWNKLSGVQKDALTMIFVEQKWYKNYILDWSEKDRDSNKIWNFDTKQIHITHKDKDFKDVPCTIQYLSALERQRLVARMCENIRTIHTLKAKGLQTHGGSLKFSKRETAIELKQYGNTHKILTSKRIRIQGIPKSVPVNGLEQFISIPGIEFTNARLLNRGTGYYVQFVCYVPKEHPEEKIRETIGIDFGCKVSFTLSNGEKYDAKVPESERLKKCQKALARKVEGSENWLRMKRKIRKKHQKISNQRKDLANKFVAKVSRYETVVIQDEQLQNWKKTGHGKAVQYSCMGTVKAKLKMLPNVVVLGRFVPTTKLCRNCGRIHDEMTQNDRVFRCNCGVTGDRDIHAAENMVWLNENNIGVGHTKYKRMEMEALIASALGCGSREDDAVNFSSVKYEAASL